MNTDAQTTAQNVPDVQTWGTTDLFKLLSKSSSIKEGWMKSTKAMQTDSGVVLQVSTRQRDNVAEAIIFIPGGKIVEEIDNEGIVTARHIS